MENVLVIGAHPDDIELGCIGTVLKLKSAGKKIIYLVMTNGGNWEKKTYIDRLCETKNAVNSVNFDEVIIGNIKDGHLLHNPKTIDYLSNIIKKYEIDTVLCQYFKDSHQDHVNVGLSAISISSICENLLFYESLTSTEFIPNLFIDISDFEEQKKILLIKYTSQIEKYNKRNQNLLSYIEAIDKLNGIKSCSNYSEGLMIYKMKG